MAAHTADTGVGFPATLAGASGGAADTHADAVLRASEERVRAAEERFRTLVEQLPLVVYVDAIDDESSNIYSSPQVEAMLGYPLAEWKRDRELFVRILHPEDRETVLDAHRRAHEGDGLSLEYRLIARDGRVVWVHDEARTIPGPSGEPVALQGYLLDITEKREAEERLRHQAFHDPLTGLPNRALFKQRVEEAIARSGPGGPGVALLILDIDDFKTVNDRFGHMDADAVLYDVGSRLRVALPPTVTVARIGGDEFAALVESDDPAGDAEKAAGAVCEALRAPTQMAGVEIFVTASIGVATGDDVDGVFRRADLAMYRAKANGKAQSVVYDRSLDDAVGERLSLLGELRRARVEEEFVLHYQPVVDLQTGAVVGAEALLRWAHPTRGIVAPNDFVPIAEESGLIVPLGRWVLQEACNQLAAWRASEPAARDLHVSVNVSARQLQATAFVDEVRVGARERRARAAGARSRDHGGGSRSRPRERGGDARGAPLHGRRARPRRLRHGLLVARDARRAALRRDEARPDLGDAHRRLRRRRAARPGDRRPRSRARSLARRRGDRERAPARGAAAPRRA